MYPTRIVRALHKHVPLIKFLGPRNKLYKEHDMMPKRHPKAPDEAALPSNTSTKFESKIDYSQLPEKYWRKGPSPEEIEVIDLGGADHIVRIVR